MASVTESGAWKALEAHAAANLNLHLRDLFTRDPRRGERLRAEAAGIYFDYSKNCITAETVALLLQLADESGLRMRIDAMFRGEKINVTEQRAVLHVALRAPKDEESMPSTNLFAAQSEDYRDRILPKGVPLLAIEAGSPVGWQSYVGPRIAVIGIDTFGSSAPGPVVMEHYGFTAENVCRQAHHVLNQRREKGSCA
jgi:glucose-6-phosphate isomerase